MGTTNFYSENALNLYEFATTYLDEDTQEYVADDFAYENMEEVIKSVAIDEDGFWCESVGNDEQRCITLYFLVSRDYTMEFGGEEYRAILNLGMRNGYYEGANLDYDIEIRIGNTYVWNEYHLKGGDTDQLVEDIITDYFRDEYYPINKGLFMANLSRLRAHLTKWIGGMVEDAERVCKKSVGMI